MNRSILLVMIFAFYACKNNSNISSIKNGNGNGGDNISLKSSIIGKWGGLNESDPVWNFSSDSVYYYEEKKSYAYSLTNDTIRIIYNGNFYDLKSARIIGDTLFFENEIGTVKAFKFK